MALVAVEAFVVAVNVENNFCDDGVAGPLLDEGGFVDDFAALVEDEPLEVPDVDLVELFSVFVLEITLFEMVVEVGETREDVLMEGKAVV